MGGHQASTRSEAHAALAAHTFVPGIGYIKHTQPPVPIKHPNGGKNCAPPADAADGSRHVFRGSGGARHILIWNAAQRVWRPEPRLMASANRMAWSADYLSTAGWAYVSPDGESGGVLEKLAAVAEKVLPKRPARRPSSGIGRSR